MHRWGELGDMLHYLLVVVVVVAVAKVPAGRCLPCILNTGENPQVPPFPVPYAGFSKALGRKSNEPLDEIIKK